MSRLPKSRLLIALLIVFFSTQVQAERDEEILISIDEPTSGDSKSGITNLRGWAITPFVDAPIDYIQLYVNGIPRAVIPHGGSRNDVCNGYPDYPDCGSSGFAMTYNYNNLPEGEHTFRIMVFDTWGDHNYKDVTFTVSRFADSFISDSDSVDFLSAQVSLPRDGNGDIHDKRIYLENVFANNGCYDIILNWDRSIQGWRTETVTPIDTSWCR